ELRHEAGDHAKEANAVVEAVAYEVVEPERADGRPFAVHLHEELALRRLETHDEGVGRRRMKDVRIRREQDLLLDGGLRRIDTGTAAATAGGRKREGAGDRHDPDGDDRADRSSCVEPGVEERLHLLLQWLIERTG